MSNDLNLCYASARDLARRIAAKEISPVEVVGNALDRIGEVNGQLNCFCFVYEEEARELATKAEQAVMAGEPLGPLHGVPIAFKDMTPTRGKRTTQGSYVFENWVPDHDAVVVERLLRAGAIMVGKTTTSEMAGTSFTESKLWGVTHNPWDIDRTPGGSSGGSGAAVAAGCVPLAEGCDMGGSVRIPAAFCGTVGLKPSFGRIPFEILPSLFDSYSHFGPLSRTVDDAALFLEATHGQDDRDIFSLPGRLEIPALISGDVRGLRIALSVDLGYYWVGGEVETNLRDVAERLRTQGAVIEEVALDWTREISDAGRLHWTVYMAAYAGQYLEKWRSLMDPVLVDTLEKGPTIDGISLKRAEFVRTEQWLKIRPLFTKFDAMLCPTTSVTAPLTGTTDRDYGHDDENGRYRQFEMTFPFNLLSPCPALSVPSGFDDKGLPTSAQVVGRPFDDMTVLKIGKAIEMVKPWSGRRPALKAGTGQNDDG